MRLDAALFEQMLKALLRGEIEIEDVCDEFDQIQTFEERGVLSRDHGLVITLQDGTWIILDYFRFCGDVSWKSCALTLRDLKAAPLDLSKCNSEHKDGPASGWWTVRRPSQLCYDGSI